MADREYVAPPPAPDTSKLSFSVVKFFRQTANRLNEVLTMKNDLPTYADNAAAVAGGLATGAWYKTAAGAVRVVV